ncbi:MAG: class I SAM-dependent methyltransferase [Sulfuriferula sp.]
MNETGRQIFLQRVKSYQQAGDPSGWCDQVYRDAHGDHTAVFWADLLPNPYLLDWLVKHPRTDGEKRALTIGCGVGDDAEALAAHGYQVIAFDISSAAIELCHKRYPGSRVAYRVADLFACPENWTRKFDLVFECNTIQVLPGEYRMRAVNAIADTVAAGGVALVSCRSRNKGEKGDAFPLPLDRTEVNGFIRAGLTEEGFEAYDDNQVPPVPHFFACYRRPRQIGNV